MKIKDIIHTQRLTKNLYKKETIRGPFCLILSQSSYLTKVLRQCRSFLLILHDVRILCRLLLSFVTVFFGTSTGKLPSPFGAGEVSPVSFLSRFRDVSRWDPRRHYPAPVQRVTVPSSLQSVSPQGFVSTRAPPRRERVTYVPGPWSVSRPRDETPGHRLSPSPRVKTTGVCVTGGTVPTVQGHGTLLREAPWKTPV